MYIWYTISKGTHFMKIQHQVEELLPRIEAEWRGFAPNERFLTVPQLMQKFRGNRRVIDGVLDRMEAEGKIRRVHRVGIFCRPHDSRGGIRVLYASPDWNGEALRSWKRALDNYTQMHPRWNVAAQLMDPDTGSIAQLNTAGFDAAILMHTAPTVTREEMKFLAEQTIPVVLLGIVPGSFEVSTVNSDDAAAAATACRYLIDRGHRKLAVITSNGESPIARKRLLAFQETADRFGASCLVMDLQSQSGEHTPTRCADMLEEFLGTLPGKLPFTAVYALSSSLVPVLTKKLLNHGYRVPEDVSVIGHGCGNEGAKFTPPVTEVSIDSEAEVAAVFSGLSELLEKKKRQFNKIMPIKLEERSSVKDIRKFQ